MPRGGYGTEERYIGRLFASWFNNNTRVSLIGNANNLNDNRVPGRNDTWTPDMMPTGTRKYRSLGLNYNHTSNDEETRASGTVAVNYTGHNSRIANNRINFLPGGDTYENSFGNSRASETFARLNNYFSTKCGQLHLGNSIAGEYNLSKNGDSNIAASFSRDPGEVTREMLDAIYSDGTPEQLESIINRSATKTDTWSRHPYGSMHQSFAYKIPKSEDMIVASAAASYSTTKNNVWQDYDITFGNNPSEAERRRLYTDNTPNHTLDLRAALGYTTYIFQTNVRLSYDFSHNDKTQDTYTFALDRLNDMGIYGTLPAGYETTLMPGWSHTSRTLTNQHNISLTLWHFHTLENGDRFHIMFMPELNFVHRNFNYRREGRTYPLSTDNISLLIPGDQWNGTIQYSFNSNQDDNYKKYRNNLSYNFKLAPQLPDPFNMIDVVNDADPLNIYLGNPDLKKQYTMSHDIKWKWAPFSHSLNNTLHLHYSAIYDKLTQGYSYDTTTGIRRTRTYNTSGNWSAQCHNSLNWQFGPRKQFTLSSSTELVYSGYADMIGVNSIEPELTKVRYRSISENINLTWQLGQHSLQARCDYLNRHTTSTQYGFRTLDATHVNFGLQGMFRLPAGFSLNTDFMCYTRRGYGSRELDTTDPIWNMRLSYSPPRNNHWVIMADAFDLLHKLSNVNYAVTASGRTITYTNTLPRYVLLSVQYRFNIQPKKR